MIKKVFIMILISLLISGCTSKSSTIEKNENEYKSYINDDGIFKVTLYIESDEFNEGDAIEIYSTLEYVGEDDTITIWHGEPYFNYSLYDDQGVSYCEGITLDTLTSTVIKKGKIYTIPFRKSGGWDEKASDAKFWEEYYKEKELKLPSENYHLTAFCNFGLSDSDFSYSNKVETDFVVQ